eukprot:5422510-Prymnesium_polylepis.2
MFPSVPWVGPDPERCSLYRLAGGGAIGSDTCNAARKAKRLLRDLVQKQAEAHFRAEMGDEAWEALSESEREKQLRVHLFDCQQHMRNIILNHMSEKQAKHVEAELAADLQAFSAHERVTTNFGDLLRGVYNNFHAGGRYYKGHSADFESWMLEHYPDVFYIHVERADGGRQDLPYDAALPIYIGRPYFVEYMQSHVFAANNILEDSLYTTLRAEQYIAMARANGLIDLRISRPHRWLAGNSSRLQDWSPIWMNWVLDLMEAAFKKGKADGSFFLDPALDVYAEVTATQPLFKEYLTFTY